MTAMIDLSAVARMVDNEADMAYRRRVLTILEWLDPQPDDVILDGGCGRGFYPGFIRHISLARIIGLELDFKLVQMARKALSASEGIGLANANLYEVPLRSDSVDKAILSEVLEHVEDDIAVLSSVARIMKPGGLLAITVPNSNYPFWWDPINKTLETLFDVHIASGLLAGIWANHVRLYTEPELRAAVTAAGLEIAEERRFTHYSFPFIHNLVYGLGKTLLEANVLPTSVAAAADRHNLSGARGGRLNPVNIGLTIFEWFDRKNVMNEAEGTPTVNLCILARKPLPSY